MPAPLGLSTAHNCTLTTHRGASYTRMVPPESSISVGEAGAAGGVGGGRRGRVVEFSPGSRRRLMRLLNSIDRSRVPEPLFFTLTYPGDWPRDPRVWKKHLKAFRERMKRRYGKFPAVWRLEYQRRGAPHFHLLVFLDVPRSTLREFVSTGWYGVVASGDEKHLKAGTQVVKVDSWRGIRSYAAKYLGKIEQQALDPDQPAGRYWGYWNKELFPIVAEQHQLTLDQFFRLRRVLRRFAGIRSTHRVASFNCFVDHETVRRLMSSMGYYRE